MISKSLRSSVIIFDLLRTMHIVALTITICFYLHSCQANAQENEAPLPLKPLPFPEWMDKATIEPSPFSPTHQNSSRTAGISEPIEPIDPDTANSLPPVRGPASKSRFQFTPPQLPDLKKLRQKATRVTYQRIASGSELNETESFQCSDIESERRKITQLEAAIQALPTGQLRAALQQQLAEQQNRLAAIEELSRLLALASATASKAITASQTYALSSFNASNPAIAPSAASNISTSSESVGDLINASMPATLSPAQRRRVAELRSILWPKTHQPQSLPKNGISSSHVNKTKKNSLSQKMEEPDSKSEVRIPERFYRPEKRKSFYQEIMEERQSANNFNKPNESNKSTEASESNKSSNVNKSIDFSDSSN